MIDINDLTAKDISQIWMAVAEGSSACLPVNIAWSFEGNGIRTRTPFLQAFSQLGAHYVELPNVLKTDESAIDLAGYLDPFYDVYIIREANHQRLKEFSAASQKPVINAMSSQAHPCEVLADGYYLSTLFPSLKCARILLFGPCSNVFKSWYALAEVLKLKVSHCCAKSEHGERANVNFIEKVDRHYDVVITDAWPEHYSDNRYCLTPALLAQMGLPLFLPTPPVTVGNEISCEVLQMPNFVGYGQKRWLLPVQRELIRYLATR